MSLAAQLKTIQQAHRTLGGGRLNSTHRPSFLFNDPAEAADLDLETVLAIGQSGMAELDILDPALRSSFHGDHFFSPTAITMDPALMDPKEMAGLADKVTVFLRRLGLHFENPASHKVLEWMIRRFRVNELMIDAVIDCILLHHETDAFVRMVQILYFGGPNDRWGFLFDQVKRGGRSIDRSFIVSRSLVDARILTAIHELVIWHGEREQADCSPSIKASLERLYSFWSMVALEHLTRLPVGSVGVEQVSKLYPVIVGLMKAGRKQVASSLHLSGMMLGVQLCQRASLTQPAMQELIEFAARTCPPGNTAELLAFIGSLVEADLLEEPLVGDRAFSHIVKLPNLATVMSAPLNSHFQTPKTLIDRLEQLLLTSTNPHAKAIYEEYYRQRDQ